MSSGLKNLFPAPSRDRLEAIIRTGTGALCGPLSYGERERIIADVEAARALLSELNRDAYEAANPEGY